ncbi:MAG: PAS domain S-box protein [Myxococcaceae bacterium]|nr:PAS domain S-box protein [Myxococcaceae bacterium]MCI0674071.1 PAS domain S-box protein [Myxococcaceae bacterium]
MAIPLPLPRMPRNDVPSDLQQRAVSLAASSFGSVQEATAAVLQLLRELLGMRSVYLSRLDASARRVTIQSALSAPGDVMLPSGATLPLEATVCEAVIASGQPRLVADSEDGTAGALTPRMRAKGARAYAGVPITTSDGRVWGTLCGLDPAPQGVSEDTVGWMQVFARLIAFQLERDEALTEVQRSHTLLAEREELLRSVLDSTAEGLFGIDTEGRCTFVNPAGVRLLGFDSADELVGRDMHALSHHTREDGRPYPAEDCRIRAVARQDRPADADDEVLWRKDGTPVQVRFHASRLVHQGVDAGAVVAFEDVTARRAEEAERRQFFALARDMMCIAGIDGRFLRVNPAFTRLLGWSEAELVGQQFEVFAHPDDHALIRAERQALSRGVLTELFECRFRHRDGSWRWLSWNVAAAPHTGVFYATGRDVTEEKQRAEFEQHLTGIVSHDLRSPLQAILLASRSLSSGCPMSGSGGADARTLAMAERIRASAERASVMVRDLLDFTRARLGRSIQVSPRTADLHAVVRGVVEEVQTASPGRDVRLVMHGECTGTWDPNRLGQVVQNLVSNALKYGDAGAPVTVESSGKETAWVTLRVHNRGAPIPAERLSTLFAPLQRATSEADWQERSVGLGLYIVKHVVEVHGGSVEVASSAEEGTTFSVSLPRHAPVASA